MPPPILSISNVTKRFGGLTAVNDVSFDVAPGEFLGIAGPNGSGKSTLFNVITSNPFGPTSGGVTFGNRRIEALQPHRIAKMGLLRTFQKDVEFPDLTAVQTMWVAATYGKGLPKDELDETAAEQLNVVGFDPSRRDVPTTNLSVYERKLLMIASALVMKPKLLMLDEPASGLTRPEIEDLEGLLRRVNAGGVTVVLIEHVLSLLLAVSERIIVLNQGSMLAEGSPESVMANPAVIEAYLGARAA